MTGEHGFESQMVIDVLGKRRAELLQLGQRKVLQFAILLDAFLHGMRDRFMGQPERNTALGEISRRCHGVHEALFASRTHALKIKDHLPHEAGSNLEREAYCIRGIKEWFLRFLQILVVSQW